MIKKILTLFLFLSCLTANAETGLVYNWGSGFQIQTRPDSKLRQEDKEYIEKAVRYIDSSIHYHNTQLLKFYDCRDNGGGRSCYKYLQY